jgi:hypothetical protein
MAAGKSVEDILAGAKETLGKAESFDKSVKGPAPEASAAPASAKHEYSNAPYAMAKSPTLKDELKAKGQMMDKAKKALQ